MFKTAKSVYFWIYFGNLQNIRQISEELRNCFKSGICRVLEIKILKCIFLLNISIILKTAKMSN